MAAVHKLFLTAFLYEKRIKRALETLADRLMQQQ